MDEQIAHATTKHRRLTLIAAVVCVCLGAGLIQWGLPWATRYLGELKPQQALRVLQVAIAVLSLSILPIAWYVASFGRKIVASQQMPPPNVKVIKNTKIVEGDAAVWRGKLLIDMAVLLAILALIGGTWLPWKLGKVTPVPSSPASSADATDAPDRTTP